MSIYADVFRTTDRNLILSNCTITVAPEGKFINYLSNLSLINGTTLRNEGSFFVRGWNGFNFMAHGEIENYGSMEFAIFMNLLKPINNQNKVYYIGSYYQNSNCEWDDACVVGNAPIER